MTLETFFSGIVSVLFGYFLLSNGGYLILNLLSIFSMRGIEQRKMLLDLPYIQSGLEPPVSLLFTTYNEEADIFKSINALLGLHYARFEIIVINDGSQDATMDVLIQAFDLLPFPEAYRIQLATQPVTNVYRSTRFPHLRVIDKVHGGKADALNAGINAARYPLVCNLDAMTLLQRDSLNLLAAPFLNDPSAIVSIGAVRMANGCELKDGLVEKTGVTKRVLPLLQSVAYLRNFLFTPLGWSTLNGMLISPPGINMIRKEAAIEAGGYRTDVTNAAVELVMRLHRLMRQQQRPYQIRFVADPVCWRKIPADIATLKHRHIQWQRALLDGLSLNFELLFSRHGGVPGTLAFPFALLFELLGPLLEIFGYAFIVIATITGIIPWHTCVAFFTLAIGLGILLSVSSLLLEEISFRLYPKGSDLARLIVIAIIGNFGFRQWNSYWRALAVTQGWIKGRKPGGNKHS